MYRVAMNVAISHYRSQARHKDVLTGAELFENIPAPSGTDADEPYEILQSLGEFDRALLLLHLDGYPYAEIAGMLGISETNVATKLSRIKQRLRRESAAGSA
jgi:RNA polymerase sigma-70 factor (ECF subfamily)